MTLLEAAGSQSFFSSATVIDWTQVFFGLTTTTRPSYATGSSTNSTPPLAHASSSVALTGREASEMSVSPLQNFWNPPPVPELPTVTRASLLAF